MTAAEADAARVFVLGYDLREPLSVAADTWSDDDRARLLLRPDVRCPASVDRTAWPVVFAPPPDANPLDFWNSLSALVGASEVAGCDSGSGVIVEVGVVPLEPYQEYWGNVFFGYVKAGTEPLPQMCEEAIGYDVADRYLLSGLSNCAPPEDALAVLRSEWASRLNSVGLFSSFQDAYRYSAICDRMVPEHAPFFPFRVRTMSPL